MQKQIWIAKNASLGAGYPRQYTVTKANTYYVTLHRLWSMNWKQIRIVKYASLAASFHWAHQVHNGGDIVMLRLAEIQISNSALGDSGITI